MKIRFVGTQPLRISSIYKEVLERELRLSSMENKERVGFVLYDVDAREAVGIVTNDELEHEGAVERNDKFLNDKFFRISEHYLKTVRKVNESNQRIFMIGYHTHTSDGDTIVSGLDKNIIAALGNVPHILLHPYEPISVYTKGELPNNATDKQRIAKHMQDLVPYELG